MIRGVIPASGSASRINGIPKFALPISDKETLLGWHVKMLSEVCDEIFISTRSKWIPIVKEIAVNVEILEIEPSTMNDAIVSMSYGADKIIVSMPDTYFYGLENNPYTSLAQSSSEVCMASFPMKTHLIGKVGQLKTDGDKILSIVDKDPKCDFKLMWGAFSTSKGLDLDPLHPAAGSQINDWCKQGISVTHSYSDATYIDVGMFSGVSLLYRSIGV